MNKIPQSKIVDLDKSQGQLWDVIVVGAGMGGGTLASQLARYGYRTLLLDRGAANFKSTDSVTLESEIEQEQLDSGKFPTRVRADLDGGISDIWAPMGCGMGGSTLLYAAALQRLHPTDFEERKVSDSMTLTWPFSYETLEPYYQKAEQLFSVCGTKDPLDSKSEYDLLPPPPMCEQDRTLFQDFRDEGLHPYRLHVGAKYVKDCGECGGYICSKDCKQDAYNACIAPAVMEGNLFVSDYTLAKKLIATEQSVKEVLVVKDQLEYQLKAKFFVLSSGAFFSPQLLLNSSDANWPHGLANSSGLVGRNLMFHANDYFAAWPSKKSDRTGNKKTLAVRDFYSENQQRYCEIQSTGLAADYGLVLFCLNQMFDVSVFKKLKIIKQFLRIPAFIAAKLYGAASVLSIIVEDYPYRENRVLADADAPSGIKFEYKIHDELKTRVHKTRRRLKSAFKKIRAFNMHPHIALNYGHPCGTLRAGLDPKNSVVNEDCRAHDLDNLYVSDASFMPTSGATNPSLTVAANALKTADAIDREFKRY